MSFHEGITAFVNKLCQPCVYGVCSIITFPLEILDLLHFISTMPYTPIPKVEKIGPIGQMVVDH
jgi:hypothetical protein